MPKEKTYIAIDLKSFYASQECVERELDPLTTNLVVADMGRTEKTICLAVSPALKKLGIPGMVVHAVATPNGTREAFFDVNLALYRRLLKTAEETGEDAAE